MARTKRGSTPRDIRAAVCAARSLVLCRSSAESVPADGSPRVMELAQAKYEDTRKGISPRSKVSYKRELAELDRFVRDRDGAGIDVLADKLRVSVHPLISSAKECDAIVFSLEKRLEEERARRNRLVQQAVDAGVSAASVARSLGRQPMVVSRWLEN